MNINQVAAQVYTVRDFLQTPQGVAESMKRIKKIGYEAVEIAAVGDISMKELKSILDGEGLTCCSIHESGDSIINEPSKVVDKVKTLGCNFVTYPYPRGVNLTEKGAVENFAKNLDSAGTELQKSGITLVYHNHHVEFFKINGTLVLDALFNQTDKKNVQSELDTYWVQVGGGNIVKWVEKLAGRLPLLHLKDYGITAEYETAMREIGNGNIEWPEIIAAAEKGGCGWFVVEQDRDWVDNDPFKALQMSFDFIKANLAS